MVAFKVRFSEASPLNHVRGITTVDFKEFAVFLGISINQKLTCFHIFKERVL